MTCTYASVAPTTDDRRRPSDRRPHDHDHDHDRHEQRVLRDHRARCERSRVCAGRDWPAFRAPRAAGRGRPAGPSGVRIGRAARCRARALGRCLQALVDVAALLCGAAAPASRGKSRASGSAASSMRCWATSPSATIRWKGSRHVGARLIVQQALEDEVSEFPGRERYQPARRDTGDHDVDALAAQLARLLQDGALRACAPRQRGCTRQLSREHVTDEVERVYGQPSRGASPRGHARRPLARLRDAGRGAARDGARAGRRWYVRVRAVADVRAVVPVVSHATGIFLECYGRTSRKRRRVKSDGDAGQALLRRGRFVAWSWRSRCTRAVTRRRARGPARDRKQLPRVRRL